MNSKKSKTNDELTEIAQQLTDVRLKFKDLSKQNQALSEARENYFSVIKDNALLKNQARNST
jgi:hypothetical protein